MKCLRLVIALSVKQREQTLPEMARRGWTVLNLETSPNRYPQHLLHITLSYRNSNNQNNIHLCVHSIYNLEENNSATSRNILKQDSNHLSGRPILGEAFKYAWIIRTFQCSCVCVCFHTHAHVWEGERRSNIFITHPPPYFFKIGSCTDPEAWCFIQTGWPVSYQDPNSASPVLGLQAHVAV